MLFVTRKPILVICAVAGLASPSPAGTDRALQEAESLSADGAFDEAITEYKRYLFFNPDSPAVAPYLAMAGIYRTLAKFEEARGALQSAIACPVGDSLRDAIRVRIAVLDMAQGRNASAQAELVRIAAFSPDTAVRRRANLFLCIAYILSDDFPAAREAAAAGGGPLRRVDSALSGCLPKRKSPGAARWLSTFVPGLGQVYAHDLRSGINALAISAATAAMTAYSLVTGYYGEALLTDIMLFWRYYSGNRHRAAEAAESYNERRDRAFRMRIMALLKPGEGAP